MSEFQIKDGTGQGPSAKVTSENQLKTVSESHEVQHHVTANHQEVYQIQGDFNLAGAATADVLILTNTSQTQWMYVTFIRLDCITDATLPAVGEYVEVGKGMAYASGGTAVTAVNTAFDSQNQASITGYDNNPTLTGTFVPIDRWRPQINGDKEKYNKHSSVRLGKDDSITIRSTHTGTGSIWTRISFWFIDK